MGTRVRCKPATFDQLTVSVFLYLSSQFSKGKLLIFFIIKKLFFSLPSVEFAGSKGFLIKFISLLYQVFHVLCLLQMRKILRNHFGQSEWYLMCYK